MGAAAEFERALIRERTKGGLASARTKGRVGGNPGLRAKDPAVLRKVRLARQDGYMERLNETAQDWVPHVRRLRPNLAWEDVLRIINGPLPEARRWIQSRLLRAVKAYVRDGFLSAEVLARAGRRETDDRLSAIVAGIRGQDRPNQEGAVANDSEADGVQARSDRRQNMAPPEGCEPVANGYQSRQIHRRGSRQRRRLIRLRHPNSSIAH